VLECRILNDESFGIVGIIFSILVFVAGRIVDCSAEVGVLF